MAGEWPTVTIEDVAGRVAMGPFGSSIKVETFVPEGIPVISGQHLLGSRLNDEVGYNFVSEEHADRLNKANVQRGDVIFTHAGSIGQAAYIPSTSKFDRYVISQRQFYLRPDQNRALPEFIVAFFKTPEGRHKLLANASQVGVPSIARPVSYLRTIELSLPPPPRTARHCAYSRHARRQDRTKPADERDAGGDGAGDLQGLVRRFRPHPRQTGRPRALPRPGYLVPLP